jgi:ABC-type transport system involved in multi-copper enzyme maturation permease subunit
VRATLAAILGGARAEAIQLKRSHLLLVLTLVQAVTFLLLVSLFGLTGSMAPTALVDADQGAYARMFVADLAAAHHSFALHPMSQAAAVAALQREALVAIITIPAGFSTDIAQGREVALEVTVDNVNTDMTDDIRRALPAAIVAFGRDAHLPGIRIQAAEHDLIDHDTGYIAYLVVSALALDAFLIAGILGAMAVAREFESGMVRMLAVAPVHPLASLAGRVLTTDAVAALAMLVTTALVIGVYGLVPIHPLELLAVLLVCIIIFGCVGVALGAWLKRTLPVASLVLGLSLPFYIGSGAMEPLRFDGNRIWIIGHLSPVYYAVGVIQNAFYGLQVTPESILVDFLVLAAWAIAMLLLAGMLLRRRLV